MCLFLMVDPFTYVWVDMGCVLSQMCQIKSNSLKGKNLAFWFSSLLICIILRLSLCWFSCFLAGLI